jgi:hypothetical protein
MSKVTLGFSGVKPERANEYATLREFEFARPIGQ